MLCGRRLLLSFCHGLLSQPLLDHFDVGPFNVAFVIPDAFTPEREYRVTALTDGAFECEGRTFKTLSAAARFITGSHLSGPAFFGLKDLAKRRSS